MKVSEAMDHGLVTVSPQQTLVDAARAMREGGVSAAVAVVDGRPAGILTERDIVEAVVDGADPAVATIGQRMTSDLVTVSPEAAWEQATELMASQGIRHVPVVDDGMVVGMVSAGLATTEPGTFPNRPASDFGETGVVSHFRGPYADGPPADDLKVETPPIDKFGFAELRRLVVAYVVLSFAIAAAVIGRAFRRRHGSWFEVVSHGAIDGFERLGPTFVKLGQLIASSPGLFPAPLANAALRTLDEVPPFDGATAREMVRKDLGRPPSQIFKSFDDTPLSAASIGQVHACVLPDGREAVIKLQRPNITARMTSDLRIMHRLASTLERHTEVGKTMNAVGVIEDLHSVTFQELNPALEAWRQHRFRNNIWAFGDNKWVTAPEIYWDYCGPHMICMERVSGTPMDEFETLKARGVDGELVLRRGAKVWVEAVALHGPFHGDMHAGNIWVLDDGRGAYLDFGIMGELTDEWKQLVRDLFYTFMIDNDFTRIARAYRRLGVFPEEAGTDEEVGQRLAMVMIPLLQSGMGDVNMGELMTTTLEMMRQQGGVSPKELMLVTKQLLYIERYVKGLAPDYLLAQDLFIAKNLFPEEVAAKAAERGITFPD